MTSEEEVGEVERGVSGFGMTSSRKILSRSDSIVNEKQLFVKYIEVNRLVALSAGIGVHVATRNSISNSVDVLVI